MPAYNESSAIGKVIRDIPRDLVRDIIVCNNNSTDQTAQVAMQAGAIVVDEPLKGYGSACLAGIAYIQGNASGMPPDVVVFMDADYSDHPEEMKSLITPILEGKDLVIGSRVTGNAEQGSLTIPQQFGNWLATRLISFFYGFRFTDLGPFRAIRWQKLLALDMQDKNYGWTVEMQVKALKHHLSCAEVPVSYRKRIGQSKVSGTVKGSIRAGHKILWTIFKSL
jgi:glycosyltransferase involved in cell wall biosynthesis